MENNVTELSVSTEVLEKMAEMATKEIEGVTGTAKKTIDLKNAVKSGSAFKGVKAENINGAIKLTVYICIKKDFNAKDVADKVQQNVKEKIQTMTGTAVTNVDVVVADIDFEEEENTAQAE